MPPPEQGPTGPEHSIRSTVIQLAKEYWPFGVAVGVGVSIGTATYFVIEAYRRRHAQPVHEATLDDLAAEALDSARKDPLKLIETGSALMQVTGGEALPVARVVADVLGDLDPELAEGVQMLADTMALESPRK